MLIMEFRRNKFCTEIMVPHQKFTNFCPSPQTIYSLVSLYKSCKRVRTFSCSIPPINHTLEANKSAT